MHVVGDSTEGEHLRTHSQALVPNRPVEHQQQLIREDRRPVPRSPDQVDVQLSERLAHGPIAG
jgi:hypothetical protein